VALQEGASANVIGGNQTAGEGNVISGNDGDGVRLEGVWYAPRTVDNQVLGNYIGVGSDGTTPLPNIVKGVYLNTLADRNQIGGPGEGEGNVIAYNRDDGVTLILSGDTAAGNQITKNSIFENEGLGIDVKDDGVTPPPLTIDSLVNNGDGTYTISGTAPANAWVEVFLAAVDPTGYGEGQTFLAEALANASGNWTATIEANTGDPITATAYPDPGINNNTTEFSEVTYLPS
jgi:hypothetical protein